MKCPDLRRLCSSYKIRMNPAGSRDAWDVEVLCKRGTIVPWGPESIGCCLETASTRTRERLAELGFVLWQDGDDGQNWGGPASLLPSACRAMGARRKKAISDEHKAKLLAGLQRWESQQVKPAQAVSESDFPAPERTQSASDA